MPVAVCTFLQCHFSRSSLHGEALGYSLFCATHHLLHVLRGAAFPLKGSTEAVRSADVLFYSELI